MGAGGSFGGRPGLAGVAGHVGFGPEQAGEQIGHREINIERFPVQADATAQHLDLGELVFGRAAEPRRQGERAAVGKLDNYALACAVRARRRGALA